MKRICVSILTCLIFTGCSNLFLQKEELSGLKYDRSDKSVYIYYNKNFVFENSNKVKIITHSILHAGKNVNSNQQTFQLIDNSIYKLIDFQAKLIKPDNSSKIFNLGEFQTVNLSNPGQVSQGVLRILPIKDIILPGDLLEEVNIYEYTMPRLGMNFALSEIGKDCSNITCTYEIPKDNKLIFHMANDSIGVKIDTSDDIIRYNFIWNSYKPEDIVSPFENKNISPEIMAYVKPKQPDKNQDLYSWKEFGDWYLGEINDKLVIDDSIKILANQITAGKKDEKSKMDAIFNFCQENIRYGQVYLKKGEIIPNTSKTIFYRKYGDCKDYAVAIYSLAKSIGLDVSLALCYRGRGNSFYKDISVSQFNHMLIHFSYNNKDFWYDGTNKGGIPGVPTDYLINQAALVLRSGGSQIKNISEDEDNLLEVSGNLDPAEDNLSGSLKLKLTCQYAVEFFFATAYMNRHDLTNFIGDWIRNDINNSVIIKNIDWNKDSISFIINIKCEIPNSLVNISPFSYVNLHRLLPMIFPVKIISLNNESVFYFPGYNHVKIDLNLHNSGAIIPKIKNACNPFNIKYEYRIEPGPLTDKTRPSFIKKYKEIENKFLSEIKIEWGTK